MRLSSGNSPGRMGLLSCTFITNKHNNTHKHVMYFSGALPGTGNVSTYNDREKSTETLVPKSSEPFARPKENCQCITRNANHAARSQTHREREPALRGSPPQWPFLLCGSERSIKHTQSAISPSREGEEFRPTNRENASMCNEITLRDFVPYRSVPLLLGYLPTSVTQPAVSSVAVGGVWETNLAVHISVVQQLTGA